MSDNGEKPPDMDNNEYVGKTGESDSGWRPKDRTIRHPDVEVLVPARLWFSVGETRDDLIPETARLVDSPKLLDFFGITMYVEVIQDEKQGSTQSIRL